MSFFHKISPGYVPPAGAGKGDLYILRERILQAILLAFCIFGLPMVVLSIIEGINEGNFWIVADEIFVYLLIFLMTLLRELPYSIRGHSLISTVYLLAMSQLLENGQLGEVQMFLITFTALTAVLFNYRNVIWTIFLSLATVAAAGISATYYPNIIPILVNLLDGASWVTAISTQLMFSTVIAISITVVISGLEGNLKKQAELSQSLEYERDTLEDRIRERTRSMQRRMVQLRTAAEISRTISGLNDPNTLLQQVVNLIHERFELYYVGIFLLDSARQAAVLQAGTGEPGRRMLEAGHHLALGGSSMIGWCVTNRQPRIALDVGTEAVRFSNPNLPLTRSELALPIIAHDRVIGAMTIQSDRPNAFDDNDITILQSIADSLAIALENDRLYHETRERLEEIRALNSEYLQRAWAETIENYGELAYAYENQLPQTQRRELKTIQVPLVLRDEVIGEIELELERDELSEEETVFVNNVTMQTAIALENARLLHETERRAVQEQKLNELASRFSRALSIDEILRAAAQELGQLPTVAEVSVQLNPMAAPVRAAASSSRNGSSYGKERA